MKKLITSLFVMLAVSLSVQAIDYGLARPWNQIMISTTVTPGDTAYFSILSRGGGNGGLCSPRADSILTIARPAQSIFDAGDSLTWRVVKGAALGTAPRVRIMNVKTGQYLYFGKKDGITKSVYMSSRNDPYNGVKDLLLLDNGSRVAAEKYYLITDGTTDNLVNNTGSIVTYKTGDVGGGAQWRFNTHMGTQPKPVLLPAPSMELSALETTLSAGGSVTLNARVVKGANDLLGKAILYNANTAIDTLTLDANGHGSFVYSGLKYGTEKFAIVYSGDVNYEPNDSAIIVSVGPNLNAKPTKVELTLPSTSELYKNVTLSIAVKTSTNDVVSTGTVNVLVNGTVKNTFTPDVLGMGSITFPNLLVGTENIKVVYVGDKMAYLNSDTASISIDITPSTAAVKPYPVTFDLCDQPEFKAWERETGVTSVTTRPYSHAFRMDSLAGIIISDTITEAFKVKYVALGYTYSKIDDCNNRADQIQIPIGTNRPTFVKFKTPWLNEGSYNVFLSHRISSGNPIQITSVTMDDNELYFPAGEMYNRILSSYNVSSNTRRRWNAKAHSGNLPMAYLGSVRIDKSSTHWLRLNVDAVNNNPADQLDMLQFVPVDMDSLSINETAAVSMAKTYYPMFDWVGFSHQPGYDAAAIPATYTTFEQFAIPYQVQDQTNWGELISHTIDSVGIITRTIGGSDYVANYVTVYRAEDKWTRISEGYADETNMNYTCSLPKGNYYYEAIKFTDIGDGSQGYRTFINSGNFKVGNPDAVITPTTSNIKAFAYGKTLTVRGIKAGARILVTDLTGKMIVNTVSTSDIFTKALYPSIYVVKVVSDNDILRTKVIVK